MDLQELTSQSKTTKPWLNIVANSLESSKLSTSQEFITTDLFTCADGLNSPTVSQLINGLFVYPGAVACQVRSPTATQLAAVLPNQDPLVKSYFTIETYCTGVGSLEVQGGTGVIAANYVGGESGSHSYLFYGNALGFVIYRT